MDKNKIIEAAAKLVAKGAYDKAIKEYQKVLDKDGRDVRVLQKMGELYQKKNQPEKAAGYFTRVAEIYSTDGFFLKAVALYKQVLKLSPEMFEANLKLADLHQQLGLMSEAMAYFQLVANAYDKAGDTKKSLDTLRKMVELDPENVASRIKLGELFAREGMKEEATEAFRWAAGYLQRHNRTDDYLRVAERLSSLDPNDVSLAKPLAKSYLEKGDQKRALAKLQVCFKVDPRDVETLSMLAQAFHGLGQVAKTVSVYKELAKLHADAGRSSEEAQVWERVRALAPADEDLAARERPKKAEPAPSAASTRAAPATAAPAAAAPARQPAAPAPQAAGVDLPKLLSETDVYLKYGLHDKALDHLRRIFSIDPENLGAHEKAYEIYVSAQNATLASEQLLNVLRLCTRNQEIERGQPYLDTLLAQNPGHPEVPAFLSVLRPGGEAAAVGVEELEEEAILVDSGDEEEIVVGEEPADALADLGGDVGLASVGVDDDEVAEVYTEELDEGEDEPLVLEEEGPAPGAGSAVDDEEQSFGSVLDDEAVVVEEEEPVVVEEASFVEEEPLLVEEDEESVVVEDDAFALGDEPVQVEQGHEPMLLDDDAALALDEPEPMLADDVDVVSEIDPFEEPSATQTELPASELMEPDDGAPTTVLSADLVDAALGGGVASASDEDEPASEECDEAGFFLDQGLNDEAREILETVLIAYPDHPRARALMARLEGESPDDAGASDAAPAVDDADRDAFDLAAELAGELDELVDDEADAALPSEDFQYSVEEVFSDFKKGLEKVVKPEDVDTHYDLGIAYKEMGLLDDAVGEFEVARKGCAGKPKEVDCLTMIGMLQVLRGAHAEAIDAFRRGLSSPQAPPDARKALQYELAGAYEGGGEPGKALYHYQQVSGVDAKYRDVAKRVQELSATTEPVADPIATEGPSSPQGPPPTSGGPGGQRTRKVGYV